jgi:hypothetical protein
MPCGKNCGADDAPPQWEGCFKFEEWGCVFCGRFVGIVFIAEGGKGSNGHVGDSWQELMTQTRNLCQSNGCRYEAAGMSCGKNRGTAFPGSEVQVAV